MPSPSFSMIPKRKRGAPFGNHNAYKNGISLRPPALSEPSPAVKGDITNQIESLQNLADITLAVFHGIENPTLEECLSALRGVGQAFDTMRGLYLAQKLLFHNQTSIDQALDELSKIPVEQD